MSHLQTHSMGFKAIKNVHKQIPITLTFMQTEPSIAYEMKNTMFSLCMYK